MIRKALCILAALAISSLPLTVGCDEIKTVDTTDTVHEGPVQEEAPGQPIVE